MKYYKKQKIGENLLYVMVWLAILLVPILNSKMMSEVHVSLSNILIAWQQIAPYLFIFIIHNAFIVRYVKRHQYMRYVVVDVLFISASMSISEWMLLSVFMKKWGLIWYLR